MKGKAFTEQLNPRYEAVVVGAGLDGLGAALELARKGVRILLLEQHNLPGGFATSFVRGRFEFEPSLHQTPGNPQAAETLGIGKYLREDLGIAVELASVPEAYRLILSQEGIDVSVPFGVEELIRTVEAWAPGSRKALTDYLGLCREVLETLNYLDRHREDFNKRELLGRYRNFLNTLAYTVEEVSDALALPEQARKIIYPYWCFLGVPMSRLSFTIWAAMLYTYFSSGAMIPRLRSHSLVSALLHRFEELGGRAQFNQRVVEIRAERGKIRGVKTASGELIATLNLICNLSPTLVFNRLVTPRWEVPDAAFRTVNARSHGVSTFVVYLGLNASKEELGLKEYSYFISANMDTDEIYQSTRRLPLGRMRLLPQGPDKGQEEQHVHFRLEGRGCAQPLSTIQGR